MSALSPWSSPKIPDSGFWSNDFLLGAGIVIIQENTDKIVVVYNKDRDTWFLPRGRKNIGESLEATALREGYEESGYRPRLLPLFTKSRQPSTEVEQAINMEPIYITTRYRESRESSGDDIVKYEYITFWYVGSIPEGAVREDDTGMADEKSYEGRLLAFDEALKKLGPTDFRILELAWNLFQATPEAKKILEEP